MDCTVHKVNNCIIGNFFILLKSFIVRGDFDNSFPSYHHQVSRPGYLSFLTRMLHYRLYFCLFNINILRILASSCCDHGESSMCSLIVKTRQIQFVSTEMSSKSLSFLKHSNNNNISQQERDLLFKPPKILFVDSYALLLSRKSYLDRRQCKCK